MKILNTEELNKIKNIDKSQRFAYLLDYYKFYFFLFIMIVILLIQITVIIFRNFQDTKLFCAFINQNGIEQNHITLLENAFCDFKGFSSWNEVVSFEYGMDFSDSSLAVASQIKLESYLHTNTLDTVISTTDFISEYGTTDIFINLNDFLPDELLKKYSDKIMYTMDSEANRIPIAISLDNSNLSSKIPLSDDSVIAVCSLANHPDVVLDFIKYCI